MKFISGAAFHLVLMLARASASQDAEVPVASGVVSASLFKNGLAVIERAVVVPGNGVFRIDDVPDPVHGTFWIESDLKVEARVSEREVEVPATGGDLDFQRDLAGAQVVVRLREPQSPAIAGKVVKELRESRSDWSRAYERPANVWYQSEVRSGLPSGSRYLVLETKNGTSWIDTSMIGIVESAEPPRTLRRKRPVLILSVQGAGEKPAKIFISYLTKGMAWAPGYRIDLSDPGTLQVRQQAVIRNELETMGPAEIRLISGFPSIEFSAVTSPMSPKSSWANFFTQLSQRMDSSRSSLRNVMAQQAVTSNAAGPSELALGAKPAGEGTDVHYESIGQHSLGEGESIEVEVASAKASYDRIVEWIVPDTRSANGRYIQDYERNQDPEKYQDSAWDAVRFQNPFRFPMTTGPVQFMSGGRFDGQQMASWTNPGESETLRINKALAVRTRHSEWEEPGTREIVHVGGAEYRRTTVKGELSIENHRAGKISMVLRRRFSGDLLGADGTPVSKLREEGVDSVNKRNELTWNTKIEAIASKTISYRYMVLVAN